MKNKFKNRYVFYLSSTCNILLIASPFIIIFRILKNKEDKKRFKEKFCLSSRKRCVGRLIWFHGASVGELIVLYL